jgi:hypothetical protein
MRRFLPIFALFLSVAACSEETPTNPPGTGGSGGAAGGAGGEGGTPIEGAGEVTGNVIDDEDAPMPDAVLSLCVGAECSDTSSDAMGAFAFAELAPGSYVFRARGPAADAPPTIGALTYALELPEETAFAFPRPLALPTTGPGKELTSGDEVVDVTESLQVTVNAADLTLPAGVSTAYVAGVRVPDEHFPPNMVPESTVAMWVFNPYGATSATDIKVALDNDFGLPADRPVEIHTIDDETGLLVKIAEGSVSGDGLTISINGGIRRLTWLVLALVT